MTTERKPTRKELELKIIEQEKVIEEQFNSVTELKHLNVEKINNLKSAHIVEVKMYADKLLVSNKAFERVAKDKEELDSVNLELIEKVNGLQEDLTNRNIAISKLKAKLQTITMKLDDFYWSPITLKKDILKIIKE